MTSIELPVAFRAWTETVPPSPYKPKKRKELYTSFGKRVLVFDCETPKDSIQNLEFGSFRIYVEEKLDLQGLFYGEHLKDEKIERLRQYANEYRPLDKGLRLYSREEFIEEIFSPEAYDAESVVVAYNAPFDISRLALHATEARDNPEKKRKKVRKQQADQKKRKKVTNFWDESFSFQLSKNRWWPWIKIKSINSKAAFIQFSLVHKGKKFQGLFLDLHTLVFALTSQNLSLKKACELFGTEHQKLKMPDEEESIEKMIPYNLNDVLITWELYLKVMEQYRKHPLVLLPTEAYSPASIGKAYFDVMGIKPFRAKQPDFPRKIAGQAWASYSGGRAEVHIRKEIRRVTYLDVRSMYPSTFVLQKLWPFVIARKIEVNDKPEVAEQIKRFLEEITYEELFDKDKWPLLTTLVQIEANEDILPVRSKYENIQAQDKSGKESEEGTWQIGLNYFTSSSPCWYCLADVVSAKLLGGKIPKILKAIRFSSKGIQKNLKAVRLYGEVEVNPQEDLFKRVIEKRKTIQDQAENAAEPQEKKWLKSVADFLKIMANATSYGIFAQFDPQSLKDKTRKVKVSVFGQEQYDSKASWLEKPGDFANPFIATFVTGAARLLLTMMEVFLIRQGTTYAFCDTDSMAVVEEDSRITTSLVRAFERLNPYDFPGSLLKIEDENFYLVDAKEKKVDRKRREPLYFYGISAKRYVLFNKKNDRYIIRKFSEHGLGHLISPTDTSDEDLEASEGYQDETNDARESLVSPEEGKEWIAELWQFFLNKISGKKVRKTQRVQPPSWFGKPAVGRLGISKPFLWKPLRSKEDEGYYKQIKPFNFMLVAYPHSIGTTIKVRTKNGMEEKPIRPVAPYEKDPNEWHLLDWIDLRTKTPLKLEFTNEPSGRANRTPAKTFESILEEYEFHPESKAAGPDGDLCKYDTIGVLERLHVRENKRCHIGKEAQDLDISNVLGDANERLQEYQPSWESIKKELKVLPPAWILEVAHAQGDEDLTNNGLYKYLRRGAIPQTKRLELFRKILKTLQERTTCFPEGKR